MINYDLLIIGSGPGGYVAAIRASQLGMKVGVVEKSELGGVCLNWGCIPTKALLKSANVFHYLKHSEDFGITTNDTSIDFPAIINRSRNVANTMSRGVQFLFKKNKIDLIKGYGKLIKVGQVEVTDITGNKINYRSKNIILATGGRARELPNLKIDGKKIISYREAMILPKQPKSMVVVGSGAIGTEFAYFYNTLGTQVTMVEFLPRLVPAEDEEISKALERSFKSKGMNIITNSEVTKVDTKGKGCVVTIKTKNGEETVKADIVLSAIGISTNLENLGIEEVGIKSDRGKVLVDDFGKTNVEGIYAIGDITRGLALAHVASAEGIVCVESIFGKNPEPINYSNIPACTYCSPEIASIGYTEEAARKNGYKIKVGKFPFSASGKAHASGDAEGFVKVIFDAKYGEWLGAHFIGNNVTEMIAEVAVARKLEATGYEIMNSIHPHPTMSEAIMEAVAAAYDEVIHL